MDAYVPDPNHPVDRVMMELDKVLDNWVPEEPALDERSYRQGYIDALTNYAVWMDGEQRVGCMQRSLKEIIADFEKQKVPVRY